MAKTSLLLLAVCAMSVVDQTVGNNYYWPSYPGTQDLLNYPQIVPFSEILQPECDKSKEGGEEKSGESSSKGNISKESEEESSEKENKSSSEEGEGSSNGSSREEGSKKESEEGSDEKKKEVPKKKAKEMSSLFPPRTYSYPTRQIQQIVYSPMSPNTYAPYRSSFVVQQPVASYPMRTNYQYVSLPTVANSYSASVVRRLASSPITRIIYSTSPINYPAGPKTIVGPGPQVYTAPVSWNSPAGSVSYYQI